MAVSEVLVVATSEPSSIADAYGLIKTILQREPEKEITILANMVRSPNEGLLVAEDQHDDKPIPAARSQIRGLCVF